MFELRKYISTNSGLSIFPVPFISTDLAASNFVLLSSILCLLTSVSKSLIYSIHPIHLPYLISRLQSILHGSKKSLDKYRLRSNRSVIPLILKNYFGWNIHDIQSYYRIALYDKNTTEEKHLLDLLSISTHTLHSLRRRYHTSIHYTLYSVHPR